jgi:SAM-dependent methyltransferase
MRFKDIEDENQIYLYCGNMSEQRRNYTDKNFISLSLNLNNKYHIQHDITNSFPLKDNTVDIIQSEDVMEHIEYNLLKDSINEIYRILKPGGLFRLSMPDYCCNILYDRSIKDSAGNIVFDRGGGGKYDSVNKKVINGGHVWFPKYDLVKLLLQSTFFTDDNVTFLHYYDEQQKSITHKIDYSFGFINRTPDNDIRVKNPYRAMSIVVDCYKPI